MAVPWRIVRTVKSSNSRCLASFTGGEDEWCQGTVGHGGVHWRWDGNSLCQWTTNSLLITSRSVRREEMQTASEDAVALSLRYHDWLIAWMQGDDPGTKPPSFAEWLRRYASEGKEVQP